MQYNNTNFNLWFSTMKESSYLIFLLKW